MDMKSFSFGGLTTATKASAVQQFSEAQMVVEEKYDSSSSKRYVVLLLDKVLNALQLKRLKLLLEEQEITNYTILYPLKITLAGNANIPGAVLPFWLTNENQWCKYLEKRKVDALIPFGQTFYLLSRETGKGAIPAGGEQFYNFITGLTYFFWDQLPQHHNPNHPATHVFPVDNTGEVFPTLETAVAKTNWQTFKTEFFKLQLRTIKRSKQLWTPNRNPIKIIRIYDQEEADKFFEEHMNSEEVAWDTETSSYDYRTGHFLCHTFAFEEDVGYYIHWKAIDPQKCIAMLKSCKKVICANGKYDTKWLWYHAEKKKVDGKTITVPHPQSFYPTDGIDLLGHCLNTGRFHGLGPQSVYFTNLAFYWQKLDDAKAAIRAESYADIDESILADYAAIDAVATLRIFHAQVKLCHEIDKKYPNTKDPRFTIWKFYKERMMYAYPHWIDLEYQGVWVNKDYLEETQKQLQEEIDKTRQELLDLWKDDSGGVLQDPKDIDSSEKLGKSFMNMQWDPVPLSKKGFYTTGDECLRVWERNKRPGVEKLIHLRKMEKCLRTFIGVESDDFREIFSEDEDLDAENGWLTLIQYHEEDRSWRLHPNHNFMMTETTRSSMNSPNLQQLNSHGFFANLVLRNMWSPDPENIDLITVDYSSLQARIALQDTHFNRRFAPDPGLQNVYGENGVEDMHSQTSVSIFEKPIGGIVLEVEDENGKQYFFGGKQNVKILRDGKPQYIQAKDLQETDTICENQKVKVEKFGQQEEINITDIGETDKILDWCL